MKSSLRWPTFVCGALVLVVASAFAQGPIPAPIAKGNLTVELKPIASGLVSPLGLVDPADGTGRLFVFEQTGPIKIIQGGSVLPTPLLDLSSSLVGLSANYDERGLLGLALAPGFANPQNTAQYQKIYTFTSQPTTSDPLFPSTFPLPGITLDHQNVVREWKVSAGNPNVVDTSTMKELIRADHPQFNHDGGTLAFGPDGNLYIGIGDGGASNDVGTGHSANGNARDTTRALGKVLRINPFGTDSANGKYGIPSDNPFALSSTDVKEIYAYGFRNPYKLSFDKSDGRLLVGDVGQNNIEEIDVVTRGGHYGWNLKEGTFKFNSANGTVSSDLTGLPSGLIDPVLQYDHDEGQAVIGGFVYRGTAIPELAGKYIFGEYLHGSVGRLFYGDLTTGLIQEFHIGLNDRNLGFILKGIGQDANGELYLTGSGEVGPQGTSGVVMQLVAVPEPSTWALAITAAGLLALARRTISRRTATSA